MTSEKDPNMTLHRPTSAGTRLSEPPVLSSDELLQEKGEILIEHRGERYRLRRTRQDKLILTK
ncbi:MAG: hemin uptake protein HemP [Alphaproteobacteria bacterium]|nr:hemin uptake protein HemP [Alphaproteobacteria bacterium]